jgi:hypothetical protein
LSSRGEPLDFSISTTCGWPSAPTSTPAQGIHRIVHVSGRAVGERGRCDIMRRGDVGWTGVRSGGIRHRVIGRRRHRFDVCRLRDRRRPRMCFLARWGRRHGLGSHNLGFGRIEDGDDDRLLLGLLDQLHGHWRRQQQQHRVDMQGKGSGQCADARPAQSWCRSQG